MKFTGEQVRKNVKGRGGITIDYIKSKDPPLIHNTKLSTHFDQFNGFNFLSIEINSFGIKAYNACNIDRRIQHLSNGKKLLRSESFHNRNFNYWKFNLIFKI